MILESGFFRLDASSSISVAAARAAYKLPYFHSHIEFFASTELIPRIDFTSLRNDPQRTAPARMHARYAAMDGIITEAAAGTLEHFLIERTSSMPRTSSSGSIARACTTARIRFSARRSFELQETLIWAAGLRRSESQPLRHYVSGVEVKIYRLEGLV